MKLSERIAKRLEELGYTIVEAPHRNTYYHLASWRNMGTCCWSAEVRKGEERIELLCQISMKAILAAEEWSITPSQRGERRDNRTQWLDPKETP